jgi:hypothetical protein
MLTLLSSRPQSQSSRLDLDRDGNSTEPSPRIWLGNIAPTATSKSLHAVLGRFGPLTDAAVFPARIGPLGYAFVKFERLEDAVRAFEALNNTVRCVCAVGDWGCAAGEGDSWAATCGCCRAGGGLTGQSAVVNHFVRTAAPCHLRCRHFTRCALLPPSRIPQVVAPLSGSKQLKMRYKPANDGPTGRGEDAADPGKSKPPALIPRCQRWMFVLPKASILRGCVRAWLAWICRVPCAVPAAPLRCPATPPHTHPPLALPPPLPFLVRSGDGALPPPLAGQHHAEAQRRAGLRGVLRLWQGRLG